MDFSLHVPRGKRKNTRAVRLRTRRRSRRLFDPAESGEDEDEDVEIGGGDDEPK